MKVGRTGPLLLGSHRRLPRSPPGSLAGNSKGAFPPSLPPSFLPSFHGRQSPYGWVETVRIVIPMATSLFPPGSPVGPPPGGVRMTQPPNLHTWIHLDTPDHTCSVKNTCVIIVVQFYQSTNLAHECSICMSLVPPGRYFG